MLIELSQLAAAVVAVIAPFLPFLLEAGKASGQKFSETLAEKGGEAAWRRARAVWNRLRNAPHVRDEAKPLALSPADEAGHARLAVAIEEQLRGSPDLAEVFVHLLGGEPGLQEVLAAGGSHVQGVVQRTSAGTGHQRVVASGQSTVRDIRQIQNAAPGALDGDVPGVTARREP